MKRSTIDKFEKVNAQLNGFHKELSVLAKKSAIDAVNAFKLGFINAALKQCNELLGAKYRPFGDFETFDPEALPSNSDVTFVIAQYIECAEKFRSDNIHQEYGDWYWNFEPGEEEKIKTAAPKKLSEK